jgi:heme-degrading monooxygenase HmoA
VITLNPDDRYMVLINTFTVEPEKSDQLLKELTRASETRIKDQRGFISANLHLSEDRTHIANYAQWRSRADYDAFINDPDTREHLKSAAGLAISFDPIIYELRESTSASGA